MNMYSILVIAGERSGDTHASGVLEQIRCHVPDVQCFGIGGDALKQAGMELLHHTSETEVTGFTEVARRYRNLRAIFNAVVERVQLTPPDLAILVDYPGFNLRLLKRLKELSIPTCYYIAPQTWAWKEGRIKVLREAVDELIVLFPFELDYFSRHGISTRYFGHPYFDRNNPRYSDSIDRPPDLPFPKDQQSIAYLPGSRSSEVRRHAPLIASTITLLSDLGARHLVSVSPGIDPQYLRAVTELPGTGLACDFHSMMSTADVAMVKSGTSTLEALAANVPCLVYYQTSRISYEIGRRFAKVNFLAMTNILAGREVVREFVQEACDPRELQREIRRLLEDDQYRNRIQESYREIAARLSGEDIYRATARFIRERFIEPTNSGNFEQV